MSHRIVLLEGYHAYPGRKRRKSTRGGTRRGSRKKVKYRGGWLETPHSHEMRFKRAAKKCAGRKKKAFNACLRKEMRKKRR